MKMVDPALITAAGYIDIHCHHPCTGKHMQIISVDMCDFASTTTPSFYYTLGVHPWFIEQQDYQGALLLLETAAADTHVLAIGECGLDKAIQTPFDLQLAVFERQLQLADQLHKPVIIHCVRAFNELINLKKRHNSDLPWIVHGFNANPHLATQFIKQGLYLSFGEALLHTRSHASQALLSTPLNRLFLETDAGAIAIERIYNVAAEILSMDIATLQNVVTENFAKVFLV